MRKKKQLGVLHDFGERTGFYLKGFSLSLLFHFSRDIKIFRLVEHQSLLIRSNEQVTNDLH